MSIEPNYHSRSCFISAKAACSAIWNVLALLPLDFQHVMEKFTEIQQKQLLEMNVFWFIIQNTNRPTICLKLQIHISVDLFWFGQAYLIQQIKHIRLHTSILPGMWSCHQTNKQSNKNKQEKTNAYKHKQTQGLWSCCQYFSQYQILLVNTGIYVSEIIHSHHKSTHDQLLSVEFSEIDVFLSQLTCGRGHPVSAKICVSYQNITPSIQNFTS